MRPNLLLLALHAALLALFAPAPARAQGFQMRLLEGVRINRSGERWEVSVGFTVPVQVRHHSPAERGTSIQIQLALLALPADPPLRESLSVPRDAPVPLESVTYEAVAGDLPLLELRFSRAIAFEVAQGRDLRSIVLRVAQEPPRRAAQSAARPPAPAADSRTLELVTEGRKALTSGEHERAALLLQEALERPESDSTPEALELLGLARERKGQLAHAKAAYEEYLRRFPDGEAAARVRQRLDALITAREKPVPLRREAHSERRAPSFDLETFGSLYVGYRYASQILDELGAETFDSSLFTEMYVDTRLRTPSALLRTQFAGGYRHQFAQDAGGDETSVSSLFVGFEQPEHGFSGSLGRRSRSSGGVLGRYDGAELAFRGSEWWEIGVLAGMPVDSSSWSGIETDRFVGGLELELGSFFGALDVELFGVAQTAGSLLDRAAVGSEIRFFRDGIFAAGFLDYDVYYRSLNVVQLTGSWQATPSTTLTAFFDYRNVPFLTTRNALVGQDGGLGGLRELFSDAEIEALAKDRTLRATTLNLGISHRLRPDLQLAFDFTTSDFSGSEASGGVEAFEGTGFDFSYLAQVMATNLLVPGSIGVASLRYLDATSDTLVFGLQARVPVGPALRVNPRFFTVYRNGDAGLDQLALRPSLRLDYRLWKLAFDVEGGFEWARDLGGGMDPPWGYFVTAGARYDF